jgi:transcriptional regulator with XRE-family HTH domain
MDVKLQFGRILRALRIEQGLSQEELSFAAKINVSYLSDLERGIYNPTLQVIVDLGRALGKHPSALIEKLEVRSPATRRRRR